MKHRYRLFLVSSVLLAVLCTVFNWIKPQCAAPVPKPSHTSGYYSGDFLLTLTAPTNGTIYYTTDGSTPTTDSAVYQGGIPLTDRTSEENHYLSLRNVIEDWLTYTPDPTPVPKGTVVRAIFVNHLGFVSDILTQTYFIGIPEPEEGYTLSLIFEEEDLFGDNGIYVTGKEYDNWYLAGEKSLPAPEPNFNQRIEVPAVAQFLEGSEERMTQPMMLRIQGNSKRGWIQKRFILEASYETSGSKLFSAELFPGASTHSVMTKDAIADAMVYDFVSDRNVALQKSVPVHVYLNGEFLYEWFLLERYDNHYFKHYYDVDNVMLVKDGVIDEDITENVDAYGELMYWVDHTDFSDPAEWAQLNQEVDIQSYIDFIAINYYLCNWDFSDYKNHLTWRSVNSEKSSYADTRWRWCIYDVDALQFTLDNYPVENAAQVNIFSDPLPYCETPVNETVFFGSLKNNPDFCKQFVLSFMDIVNNNFAPERASVILEKYGLSLDWMDGYFRIRPEYAANHLAEEFNLTGTLETVTIKVQDDSMGNITVNTSAIDMDSGSWTGRYYTDYPITITATPNDGYRFLGWKGASNSTDNTLTLPVGGGLLLEALFEKIP